MSSSSESHGTHDLNTPTDNLEAGAGDLVERLRAFLDEEAADHADDAADAIERGERPDLWDREITLPVALLREAAAQLAAVTAENARLRERRTAASAAMDEEKELRARILTALAAFEATSLQLIEMSKRVVQLEQENERLRAALLPFAEAADVFAREYPAMLEKPAASCGIRFDALQAARAAVSQEAPK